MKSTFVNSSSTLKCMIFIIIAGCNNIKSQNNIKKRLNNNTISSTINKHQTNNSYLNKVYNTGNELNRLSNKASDYIGSIYNNIPNLNILHKLPNKILTTLLLASSLNSVSASESYFIKSYKPRFSPFINFFQKSTSIIEDDFKNLFITGNHFDGSIPTIVVSKFDQNGNFNFSSIFRLGSFSSYNPNQGNEIIETQDNNLALIGSLGDIGSLSVAKIFTTLLDKEDLTPNWSILYGNNTYPGLGNSILETNDSNFVLCGQYNNTAFGPLSTDIFVSNIQNNGAENWKFIYGSNLTDSCQSITKDSDGNIYLVANSNSFSNGSFGILFMKLNSTGSIIVSKLFYGEDGDSFANKIILTKNDNPVIVGKSNSFSDFNTNSTQLVFKLDKNQNYSVYFTDLIFTEFTESNAYDVVEKDNKLFVVGFIDSNISVISLFSDTGRVISRWGFEGKEGTSIIKTRNGGLAITGENDQDEYLITKFPEHLNSSNCPFNIYPIVVGARFSLLEVLIPDIQTTIPDIEKRFTGLNTNPIFPLTLDETEICFGSLSPTLFPTSDPTVGPTLDPTFDPTVDLTDDPTESPSKNPSYIPTNFPSIQPTESPTNFPSIQPTESPTNFPSIQPTESPTNLFTDSSTSIPIEDSLEDDIDDGFSYIGLGIVCGLSCILCIFILLFLVCCIERRVIY